MEKLTPWLIEWAYRQGIFPMETWPGVTEWFRPDPRAIIPLDGFRVSRSLRKSAKRFEVTFDTAYEEVMRACSRPGHPESWISEEFIQVYTEMFRMGNGHSAEAWLPPPKEGRMQREPNDLEPNGPDDPNLLGRLAGGVYGVALGGAFMAESMFHTETDAGKVALWRLIERLGESGYLLFDVQYMTPHLRSLGAVEISLEDYMRRLSEALGIQPHW